MAGSPRARPSWRKPTEPASIATDPTPTLPPRPLLAPPPSLRIPTMAALSSSAHGYPARPAASGDVQMADAPPAAISKAVLYWCAPPARPSCSWPELSSVWGGDADWCPMRLSLFLRNPTSVWSTVPRIALCEKGYDDSAFDLTEVRETHPPARGPLRCSSHRPDALLPCPLPARSTSPRATTSGASAGCPAARRARADRPLARPPLVRSPPAAPSTSRSTRTAPSRRSSCPCSRSRTARRASSRSRTRSSVHRLPLLSGAGSRAQC